MNPLKYCPRSIAEFIGPAMKTAATLEKIVRNSGGQTPNDSLKVMLNGPPGTGKSTLAKFLIALLGGNQWNTTKLSGTQVKLETVEDLARAFAYKSMGGAWRILWIEEVEKMTAAAQVRLLPVLDDLPDGVAVICTSNCMLSDFEERFQTRFQIFEVAGPTAAEMEPLLSRFLTNAAAVRNIAINAAGNVRQALLDTQTALMES